MKNALRRSAMVLAVGTAVTMLVTFSLRAADEKLEGDLKKMQGTWVRAGDDGPDLKWTFKGDVLKADVDGMVYTSKVTLDPKAKPNPTVDLAITDGPGNSAGITAKGIYKFDGENLVICVTKPGGDKRPAAYEGVDDESYLFTLKPESK